MLYKFLCLNRTKPTYNQETVWIEADSEQDARFQLTADYRLLLDRPIAKFAKNPANLTRCKVAHSPMADEPEQNHSLPTVANVGSIARTTTFNADRKRYLSGIFLPTIHQGCGLTTPVIYSELAVRATRRTKAGNRANNADCLKAVVEPLPHPIQVQAVSFSNKLTRTFKMLFKFLFTGSRLRIAVHAKTLADAYKRLPTPQPNSVPVLIARIPAKGVCYA